MINVLLALCFALLVMFAANFAWQHPIQAIGAVAFNWAWHELRAE